MDINIWCPVCKERSDHAEQSCTAAHSAAGNKLKCFFKLAEGTPCTESERRGAAKAKNSAAYLPHMGLWAVA